MLKFDDRFARQDRCEPPPEFPLASPCSSIVHHLSGPSTRALAPRPLAASWPRAGVAPAPSYRRRITPVCLSCAVGVRWSPVTRARARLLGPCFKTGRSECREPRDPDVGRPSQRATRRGGTRGDDLRAQLATAARRPATRATPPLAGRRAPPTVLARTGQPTPRGPVTPPAARRAATLPPGFWRPGRRSSRSAAAKCTGALAPAE